MTAGAHGAATDCRPAAGPTSSGGLTSRRTSRAKFRAAVMRRACRASARRMTSPGSRAAVGRRRRGDAQHLGVGHHDGSTTGEALAGRGDDVDPGPRLKPRGGRARGRDRDRDGPLAELEGREAETRRAPERRLRQGLPRRDGRRDPPAHGVRGVGEHAAQPQFRREPDRAERRRRRGLVDQQPGGERGASDHHGHRRRAGARAEADDRGDQSDEARGRDEQPAPAPADHRVLPIGAPQRPHGPVSTPPPSHAAHERQAHPA